MTIPTLQPIFDGWAKHEAFVIETIGGLTPEQLAFRTAPHQWAIWQLAAHIALSRAYWFHDVLGEGDAATRDMFRVDRTTIPGLSPDDAGWEDVEDHPRSADELADGLTRSWAIVDDCLRRWTADDLAGTLVRPATDTRPERTHLRGWVVWHVLEHDVHHAGEISQILGSNGLTGFDF